MVNKKIYDNSIENWIIIEPKKPIINFIPLEQENYIIPRSAYYNVSNPSNIIDDKNNEIANHYANSPTNFENAQSTNLISNLLPKKFAGVHSYMSPWNINENFANFFLIDLTNDDLSSFDSTLGLLTGVNLFPDDDTNKKIVNIEQGIQAIRIPIDRFFTTEYNYGNYIIKISPKFIETEVISVIESNVGEELNNFENNLSNNPEKKNTRAFLIDRIPFFNDTNWNFKNFPTNNSLYSKQTNRLIDSVVEIYRGGVFIGKKTIISDDLNHNGTGSLPLTSNTGLICLGPDLIGWDPKEEFISVGDTLRIYPRESYFDSINIFVEFLSKKQDFENLLRFLQNDTVRDLKTGVFEIYDDNGISFDQGGNINGEVIMKYQISKTEGKEFRKRLSDI